MRTAGRHGVAWLLTQAVLNIGAVLQLLPITGVPLPLVSYGGSSLVPTLVALGMLMSFARGRGIGRPARPGRGARASTCARRGSSAVHVVLAGGGTAGHVEPALNLADCLRRRRPGHRHHGAGHASAASRRGSCPSAATTWR